MTDNSSSLDHEKQHRKSDAITPRVINASDYQKQIPQNRALWVPNNSSAFSLFLARKGSNVLQQIEQGLRDPKTAASIESRLTAQFKGRPELSIDEATKIVIGSQTIAALSHAGEVIADNLIVPPGLDVIALVFPVEGGRINPDNFSVKVWNKGEHQTEVEALIIYREPGMTEAEHAASNALASPGKVGIRVMLPCRPNATTIAATYVAAAAAAAWAAAFAGPVPGAMDLADIGDDVLDEASIDQLVAIKTKVLSKTLSPN